MLRKRLALGLGTAVLVLASGLVMACEDDEEDTTDTPTDPVATEPADGETPPAEGETPPADAATPTTAA